jgi:hypothetical protein
LNELLKGKPHLQHYIDEKIIETVKLLAAILEILRYMITEHLRKIGAIALIKVAKNAD